MPKDKGVSIKINEDTKEALLALAGKMQLNNRKTATIDDAIKHLFKHSPESELLKELPRKTQKAAREEG